MESWAPRANTVDGLSKDVANVSLVVSFVGMLEPEVVGAIVAFREMTDRSCAVEVVVLSERCTICTTC